jgi:hypothetical protein
MPEIPLVSGGEALGPIVSHLIVQTVMWCPKDSDSVYSYLSLVIGSSIQSELYLKTTKNLAKAAVGGLIAGEVFLKFLQLKVHRPRDASVNKAAFIVSRELENRRSADGRRPPSNLDRVHKFWTDFRPAAHLWAALRLQKDAGWVPVSPDVSGEAFAAYSYNLILCADALLSRAEAAGIDVEADPWRLPEAYPRKPIKLEIPPPTASAIECLKNYRAPVRPK